MPRLVDRVVLMYMLVDKIWGQRHDTVDPRTRPSALAQRESNADGSQKRRLSRFLARASERTMFLLRTAAQRSFIPFDNLFIVHWKRLATCALATAPTTGFVACAIRIGGSMLESQEC